MKCWRCVVAILVVLLAGLPSSQRADAFPVYEASASCGTGYLDFDIVNSPSQVDAAELAATRTGLKEFNDLRDRHNASPIGVFESGSGPSLNVRFVPSIGGSTTRRGRLESGACTDPSKYLLINYSAVQGEEAFRDVARHEVGHALGLSHTGVQDGLSWAPTMHTCGGINRTMRNDDWSAALYFNGPTSVLGLPLVANLGFEMAYLLGPALPFYGTVGSVSVTSNYEPVSGTFFTGNRAVRIDRTTSHEWPGIYQNRNYYHDDLDSGGRSVRLNVDFVTPDSNGKPNSLYVMMSDRRVDYEVDATPPCDYEVPNRDLSEVRANVGTWFTFFVAWLPSSSQKAIYFGNVATTLTGGDAVDLQFQVRGTKWLDGPLYVDNVEMLDAS